MPRSITSIGSLAVATENSKHALTLTQPHLNKSTLRVTAAETVSSLPLVRLQNAVFMGVLFFGAQNLR